MSRSIKGKGKRRGGNLYHNTKIYVLLQLKIHYQEKSIGPNNSPKSHDMLQGSVISHKPGEKKDLMIRAVQSEPTISIDVDLPT